ncbi:MAG: glycerol-3-phosphate acyltransferase PlsX [Planctomycetota bacterium]|jgi:glycerol-3-phosphate acyltransferase PlsX
MLTNRIALDVMGGDNAPTATLEGVVRACDPKSPGALSPERLLLVGDEDLIRAYMAEHAPDMGGFEILATTEVIGMDEKPAKALRAKPNSSIAGCVGAVKKQLAGSLVSMGNTGAVVGASTLGLGTLPGVRRPGIAVTIELTGKPITVLDMGANVAPKPQHLLQYGVMGSVLMRDCLDVPSPRVGLLNIGEESSKGTDLLRSAHELLQASDLDFVGNLEADDLFRGGAEVMVTDGFTGNVVLKLMEGMAGFMMQLVLGELKEHKVAWGAEALSNVRRKIDYSEYGGALLLGVQGVVVIGHGRSDGNAVSNALGLAARALDSGVNEDIVNGLAASIADQPTES